MLQTTSKFEIFLALVICSSLCEFYEASVLPVNDRFYPMKQSNSYRMKRFGHFKNIAGPSIIDRCIMACAMCSPEVPSYINEVNKKNVLKILANSFKLLIYFNKRT